MEISTDDASDTLATIYHHHHCLPGAQNRSGVEHKPTEHLGNDNSKYVLVEGTSGDNSASANSPGGLFRFVIADRTAPKEKEKIDKVITTLAVSSQSKYDVYQDHGIGPRLQSRSWQRV